LSSEADASHAPVDLAPAPEIRIDQLTGLRTIVAPGRASRPQALDLRPSAVLDPEPAGEQCPLCEGNEAMTPPELWANRAAGDPDTPGWHQRAVPNLYPALIPGEHAGGGFAIGAAGSEAGMTSSADPLRSSARVTNVDLFGSAPAQGAHEVIANHPAHRARLIDLGAEGLAEAMAAWRGRIAAHSATSSYVQLIVNEGAAAGASLSHSHAQLYALPFVPAEVARERERFNAYHERTLGSHLLEDVIVEEVRRRDRLVAFDSEAILFCPWASRSPFELRLAPRTPAPAFERDERGAAMLMTALTALAGVFGTTPQLNLWVRTAPRGTEEFHWHLDLVPRLGAKAGFELGTGVDIEVYPPEQAASELREALVGSTAAAG
jgi:UDPglucose--hexose-1-phosphate uridylyltransferase